MYGLVGDLYVYKFFVLVWGFKIFEAKKMEDQVDVLNNCFLK